MTFNSVPPESEILSPAKINLFLHVTGRRKDGYHQLQTIMQFLDWGDRMIFRVHGQGRVRRFDDHEHALPPEDLCVRAALRLKEESDQTGLGVDIRLTKRIPPGSGLGGGSSNAATTLMVLNRLWKLNLPPDRLLVLGRELGADVPVFLNGFAAWAEGTGDRLQVVSPPTGWVVVALPKTTVITAEMFQDPELRRDHEPVDFDDFMSGRTGNDLETVTFRRHPAVARTHSFLSQFGQARMSGSGGAVFVTLDSREKAEEVVKQLQNREKGFIAKRLNCNPVMDWISSRNPPGTDPC